MLLLISCGGVGTKNHPPLVFALNLSDAPVSLTLDRAGEVLVSFDQLAPMESRPLTRIPAAEGAVLRRGIGGDPPDLEWTDPSGTPYSLRFQTGNLYAIVVDPLGRAAVYALPETYSDDPKVCIINVTSTTLSQVQAAPDWSKNVKIYAQDVVPIVPSEFYSIEPKTLGLFWQTLEQTASGSHHTAMGLDGHPLRQTFAVGRTYLFLAGDGAVRDLTPTLD